MNKIDESGVDSDYYFGGLTVKPLSVEQEVFATAGGPLASCNCAGCCGPFEPMGPFEGPFGPFPT